MGKIHTRAARIAALLVATTLASTLGIQAAGATSSTYRFDKSPYVRSISIDNATSDVVVTYRARRTGKSVFFAGWSVELDTVPGRASDFGASDFYASGKWGRAKVQVWEFAADESYNTYRVACPEATSTLQGRVKRVVIPRSCLTLDEVEPTQVRSKAGVYGTRKKPSGTTCWGVGAPRRGFTAWLAPSGSERTVAGSATQRGSAARGC